MSAAETISLCIFMVFWWIVFSLEIKFLLSWFTQRRLVPSKFLPWVHVLAITGIVCFLYGYFVEPYWIEVKHVTIESPKIKGPGITLVQISDLQCDLKIRSEKKLVNIMNDVKPDVIVFTGDAVNTIRAWPIFQQTMSSLQAGLGKFAVRGNWDIPHKDFDLFQGTGFSELNGRTVTLIKGQTRVNMSGMNVINSDRDGSFLNRIPRDGYNIFLYHYPGIQERLPGVPVDLYLSGHTHGGQVCLPFYGAIVTLSQYGKKYESGRYNFPGGVLYVNRGLGMEGNIVPRIRFLSRPEVTVFHITGMRGHGH